jgi:hypothetical protein
LISLVPADTQVPAGGLIASLRRYPVNG